MKMCVTIFSMPGFHLHVFVPPQDERRLIVNLVPAALFFFLFFFFSSSSEASAQLKRLAGVLYFVFLAASQTVNYHLDVFCGEKWSRPVMSHRARKANEMSDWMTIFI